jgi:hypothetical protein
MRCKRLKPAEVAFLICIWYRDIIQGRTRQKGIPFTYDQTVDAVGHQDGARTGFFGIRRA